MKIPDPYRIFFPIGWLLGVAGVFLWPLMLQSLLSSYPKEMHADIMMGGFLVFFVAGFLMTALPRFTLTQGLQSFELAVMGIFSLALCGSCFVPDQKWFHAACLGVLGSLLLFCLRRIRQRLVMPPPPLIFVIAGLVGGMVSLVLLLRFDFTGQDEMLRHLGQLFFYQGLQACLVLGVGIFLIPNLLGHPGCQPPVDFSAKPMTPPPFFRLVPKPLWVVLFCYLASFFVEVTYSVMAGRLIRVLLFTLVSLHDWKIYRLPPVRSILAFGLWISCWLLVGGLWLQVLVPAGLELHVRHLTYIGGYGLMTLMIATRVTLAHGGHDLGLERHSMLLKATLALILLAVMARVTARLLPETFYLQHLQYAAWSWIAALLLWGLLVLPRLMRVEGEEE